MPKAKGQATCAWRVLDPSSWVGADDVYCSIQIAWVCINLARRATLPGLNLGSSPQSGGGGGWQTCNDGVVWGHLPGYAAVLQHRPVEHHQAFKGHVSAPLQGPCQCAYACRGCVLCMHGHRKQNERAEEGTHIKAVARIAAAPRPTRSLSQSHWARPAQRVSQSQCLQSPSRSNRVPR